MARRRRLGLCRGPPIACGVEIHQKTAVTGIDVEDGRVVGVRTDGAGSTTRVLSAVAGYTPRITRMVGLRTPIVIQPLQACVTEPLKPWLDQIVVSASLHVYVANRRAASWSWGHRWTRTSCTPTLDAGLRRGPGRPPARPVPFLSG